MSLVLALDAMGGDSAPDTVIEGASLALIRNPDIHFLVYGDASVVTPILQRYNNLGNSVTLHHTDEAVLNDTKPSAALRGLKRSSMRLAIEAVSEGTAKAVVSAGNTGAYMALAKIILRTIEGIDRPAIATTIPTKTGACIALDLGANVDCTVENLIQFAVMGDAMARRVLQIESPKIGLLNVGSEELKGNAVVQQAGLELREIEALNYQGFAEGNDITSGRYDVIITDGFTGNVALKTIEGVVKLLAGTVKKTFASSLSAKIGYLIGRSAFKVMRNQMDPRNYNGAPFVGLKGIAVKSHGSADGAAFANAIGVAVALSREVDSHNLGEEIETKLREI